MAELFEDNVANMETVIQHYQIAADYFKGEESTSSANKCLVKVAQYTATMEKYEKAIQIYEQVSEGLLFYIIDISSLSLPSDRDGLYPVQPVEVRRQGLLLQGPVVSPLRGQPERHPRPLQVRGSVSSLH